jgi:hypothetical protein
MIMGMYVGVRNTIDLSPEEFLVMKKEHPEAIKSVEILPPILGKSTGFGKIRVNLSYPKYEVTF